MASAVEDEQELEILKQKIRYYDCEVQVLLTNAWDLLKFINPSTEFIKLIFGTYKKFDDFSGD